MLGACSLDQNSLFQLFPIWTSQDESVLRDLNRCICFVFFFLSPWKNRFGKCWVKLISLLKDFILMCIKSPRNPLRNLYAGQEATVRTGHGTTDWFRIGKGIHQGCILSPCLFNLYAECIMRNAGLGEAQAGIKIAGRIINNLRYADDTTLNGRKWRRTKEPLDESERGEWKSWLKAQHSEN